jgi:hypothetical protein
VTDEGPDHYRPPQSPIASSTVRGWAFLRWLAAIICGLCSVLPLYFAGMIVYLTDNRIRAFGWQDYYDRFGLRRITLIVFAFLMIGSCGVLFLMASHRSVAGKPVRALVWFVVASVAGGLGYFVFGLANSR